MSELQFKEASSVQGKNLVFSQDMVKDPLKQFFLGAQVTGEYVGFKVVNTVNGESNIYNLKINGEVYGIWGTTVLDSKFTEGYEGGAIPVGATVRITYLGLQKAQNPRPGAKPFHNFKVEVAIPSPAFKEADSAGY